MAHWITDILKRRELTLILIGRNLKIRYKNSFLGFFWTLLGPLFLIVIYSLFLGLLKVPIHLPTLVTGIIAWQFVAMCTGDALQSIVGNANLITKASFPRLILPISMVGANAVNFLLSFAVLVVYLLVAGAAFSQLWLLPLVFATHVALGLGLALIIGTANVFFRDAEHILSVVMLAWFFLSPVIYEPSLVQEGFPAWVQGVFFLNPMSGILTAYRQALLGGTGVSWNLIARSFAVAWAVLAAGIAVFRAADPRFGDEL